MDFNEYVKAAINRQGLRNDASLAREINMTKGAFSQLTTGKNLPSDATMIKIADLAGQPKEEALLKLNIWRAEKSANPEVKKIWERMSKMIVKTSLLLPLLFATSNAYASSGVADKLSDVASYTVYYVYLYIQCLSY